jgi:FkbM family methyltransferase
MWYLREIPFSRAFCVEPDPRHLAAGQDNMRLNGLQASFMQASIGEQFVAQAPFTTESGESLVVAQQCGPSLMMHWQLDAIEVLHADVQGAELALLKGCDALIAEGKIRFFVISTHHALISGSATMHADCVSYLKARGANILCEHDIDESFSGDGLIVAAMRAEDRIIPPIAISRCRRADSLFASGY